MIQEISLAISKIIQEMGISPNTIRINPVSLDKLKSDNFHYGQLEQRDVFTVLGLRVITSTKVEEGMCEIYNDKIFVEVAL